MSENEEIRIIRTQNNKKGVKGISITLPDAEMAYITDWARKNAMSVSRAVAQHIWKARKAYEKDNQA